MHVPLSLAQPKLRLLVPANPNSSLHCCINNPPDFQLYGPKPGYRIVYPVYRSKAYKTKQVLVVEFIFAVHYKLKIHDWILSCKKGLNKYSPGNAAQRATRQRSRRSSRAGFWPSFAIRGKFWDWQLGLSYFFDFRTSAPNSYRTFGLPDYSNFGFNSESIKPPMGLPISHFRWSFFCQLFL